MLTVLLHSSKTMRPIADDSWPYQEPRFLDKASVLTKALRKRKVSDIETLMKVSNNKAAEAKQLIDQWDTSKGGTRPAIDAFLGDIYSGLQVQSFDDGDRAYANDHLLILSGLYGALRALDSIKPYRLEMGYPLSDSSFKNLYDFWGDHVSSLLKTSSTIVNLSAVEYTKSLLKNLDVPVITPKFLTISPKTGEPIFVTVHAKVARGAFAHWLIKHRVSNTATLTRFNEIGYKYDEQASTPEQPVYVCKEFKGIGLSVRLT